jgi:hypothetical protein
MSGEIQRVLIVAAALALVVVIALVLRRRLLIRVGDKELDTGGREHAIDQRATAKGLGARIDDAAQNAASGVAGSQVLDARGGGQIKGVRQTIRDPGDPETRP